MKSAFLNFIVLCVICSRCLSSESGPTRRHVGIVNLPERKFVVPEPLKTDRAKINRDIEDFCLDGRTNKISASITGITLDNAGLETVLRIYQELSERTLLISPLLPSISFSLKTNVTNSAQALSQLEKILGENKISVIPDRDIFTLIIPTGMASKKDQITPAIKDLPPISSKLNTILFVTQRNRVVFNSMPARMVVDMYAEIIGRKFDRNKPMPVKEGDIDLRTQTPITVHQLQYALATIFRLHGFEIVPTGEEGIKFITFIPLKHVDQP